MGYICHNAIIVTAFDQKYIKPAHKKAREIFSQPTDGESAKWNIVSPIVNSPLNGYASFFVAPDGSKEGWPESDAGNGKRETFIRWMIEEKDRLYLDWAEIQYGDDGGVTKIVHHSDDPAIEEEG